MEEGGESWSGDLPIFILSILGFSLCLSLPEPLPIFSRISEPIFSLLCLTHVLSLYVFTLCMVRDLLCEVIVTEADGACTWRS